MGIFGRSRGPIRRWVVRLHDPVSGRADYLFAAARSEGEATKQVTRFIEYVERGRSQMHLSAEAVPAEPRRGDLGASPSTDGRGQDVKAIRRWHVGGADLDGQEPDLGRTPDPDDMLLIAEWRDRMQFQP